MENNWKGTKGEWKHVNGTWVDSIDVDGESIVVIKPSSYSLAEYDANATLIADAGNTIQQCDKLPSQLLSDRNEAIRIIREAIDLYENHGLDIPETWVDNAFLFIKQIEHGK